MPTVILIDSSLSMLRLANEKSESSENGDFQLLDLAKWGIDLLLNHIEQAYCSIQILFRDFLKQIEVLQPAHWPRSNCCSVVWHVELN